MMKGSRIPSPSPLGLLGVLVAAAIVAVLAGAVVWSGSVSARTSAPLFTLTPSAGSHGTITPPVPQAVEAGSNVTFTMAPDVGFHVADVHVDDVSVGAVTLYTFQDVQADHTISATFARDVAGSFVIVPSAGAHGVITPPIVQTVVAGGNVTFTIIPDSGYKVQDVLVDDVSVGPRTTYDFTNVQADHTISATFEVDTQTKFVVTPSPGAHGQITPPVPQTVAAGGSVQFEMVPDAGYHVADVLVDDVSVGPRTTYEFTNVQADHRIAATFAKDAQASFTITPSPGPHGQIAPPVPQTVAAGTSITFSIVPDPGYHVADVFVDDSSVGARGSYQFTNVQSDHTIAATFAEDAGPSVTVSSPAGGERWTAGSTQTVAWALSAAAQTGRFTVWAVPASGPPVAISPGGSPVAVEAGKTAYEAQCKMTVPAPGIYEVLVRYESAAGDLLSEARSAGVVTVQPSVRVSVTSPSGSKTWRRGTTKTIAWKLSTPVAAGEFRVWAVAASGKRYAVTPAGKPVTAQASRLTYSTRWKVSTPAGKRYRILVEYWWSGSLLAAGRSSGTLTITR